MMRVFLLFAFAATFAQNVPAQSLDIGGIDLRLGQEVPDALKSLSAYRVQYNDQLKSWFITQKKGEDFQMLGNFSATDNKVSSIIKAYSLSDDGDTQRIYTRAAKDVRQRGGNNCIMQDVEFTDDLIHQIETRCGSYRLIYSFPWILDKDRVSAGIAITLSARR